MNLATGRGNSVGISNNLRRTPEPEGPNQVRDLHHKQKGPPAGVALFVYGGERGIRTLSDAICRLAMPSNVL